MAILGGLMVGGCSSGAKSEPHAALPRSTATCEAPPTEAEPDVNAKLPPFLGPMVLVQPTKMADRLRAAGLDPKHLPPFDSLDRRSLGVVMRTFTVSLGLQCVGCHDLDDYKKPSPRKRVAKRMWDDFVRVLALEDGTPAYCDSCHQGSVQVIDRRDKGFVAGYMDDVFVGRLRRADGKDHDCGTCHGDPPEFKFLSDWRRGR